jgi:hypothetical protein
MKFSAEWLAPRQAISPRDQFLRQMPNAVEFLQPAIPAGDPDRRYRGIGGNIKPFGMKLLQEEQRDVGVHDKGNALLRAAELFEGLLKKRSSSTLGQFLTLVQITRPPTSIVDICRDGIAGELLLNFQSTHAGPASHSLGCMSDIASTLLVKRDPHIRCQRGRLVNRGGRLQRASKRAREQFRQPQFVNAFGQERGLLMTQAGNSRIFDTLAFRQRVVL